MTNKLEYIREDRSEIEKLMPIMVIAIIGVFVLLGTVVTIPAGTRGVLLVWGAATNVTLDEGLHFIVPIQDSVQKMNVQTQLYSVPASSASRDLQDVRTDVALNFHIDPSYVSQIYDKYGIYYGGTIIAPAVQEAVKASTAQYNATELITERPLVRDAIQERLTTALSGYHIIVEQLAITNFTFSPQYTAAIEEKAVSQQNQQQQLYLLNITKIQANQTVAIARGNATARILRASANATAILLQANATAHAIELINAQLASNPGYIKYLTVVNWNGKLPTIVMGNSGVLPLINFNTSSVLNGTG